MLQTLLGLSIHQICEELKVRVPALDLIRLGLLPPCLVLILGLETGHATVS